MIQNGLKKQVKSLEQLQGNDYVRLDHGLLTVDQIDMFLKALPFEVTYADDNNQFLYYNFNKPANKMLAPRVPASIW